MAAPVCRKFISFNIWRNLSVNMFRNTATTVNKSFLNGTFNVLINNYQLAGTVSFSNSVVNALTHSNALENKEESPVGLSESCVQRIKSIQSDSEFLRVAVDGGGCSGFQYTFNMDTVVNPDDRIFEKDGAKVIVDEISLGFLRGSIIDYQEELIRSAFRVKDNPNADNGCSCGTSFSVKN